MLGARVTCANLQDLTPAVLVFRAAQGTTGYLGFSGFVSGEVYKVSSPSAIEDCYQSAQSLLQPLPSCTVHTMLLLPFLLVPAALASPLSLLARENDNPPTSNQTTPNVIRSTWDGQCFYPTADETFHLPSYLGKWFQIAGTIAPFTAGCSCITAEYSLNENGTVDVQNTCQAAGRTVPIRGTAEVADAAYGSKGVLRVQFPGQPAPECPGPNYIVQGESASAINIARCLLCCGQAVDTEGLRDRG